MPVTRLPEETLARVRQMAREDGDTIQGILVKAVEAYRRARTIDRLNADFHRLQADPAAWAEDLAERQASEGTLADDLDDERSHA